MKVQNSITFIISRNYGRPLSLSQPAWRVYAAGLAALLMIGAMTVLTVLYLVSYPRVRELQQEQRNLRKERDALREQLLSANQEAFERKETRLLAASQGRAGGSEPDPGEVRDSGGDDQYTPPIRVDSMTARVSDRSVEVAFRLVNQSDANNRGGFLYAIFENDDKNPPAYLATPPVNINEEGFPQSYKYGIRFTRFRDAVTFHRKVKRTSGDEYFTHVTLFLFSVRGGLILKERFELEKNLFFKEQPVVRTQQVKA